MASHVTSHLPHQQCHKRHMGSKLLSCFSYSPFSTKAWAFLHFPLSLRNLMFLSVSFPTTMGMALGRDWEFAKIVAMWGQKEQVNAFSFLVLPLSLPLPVPLFCKHECAMKEEENVIHLIVIQSLIWRFFFVWRRSSLIHGEVL